jgi:hypothetical protein
MVPVGHAGFCHPEASGTWHSSATRPGRGGPRRGCVRGVRAPRDHATRRSVDAYPDFQSVTQTHRLLAGGCLVVMSYSPGIAVASPFKVLERCGKKYFVFQWFESSIGRNFAPIGHGGLRKKLIIKVVFLYLKGLLCWPMLSTSAGNAATRSGATWSPRSPSGVPDSRCSRYQWRGAERPESLCQKPCLQPPKRGL